MAHDLLRLRDATNRVRPFDRRYLGTRPIEVDQIIGTDNRGGDFDREFRPLRPDLRTRLRRVENRFPNGEFPPIVAYKLGDAYFVVDGHHRVAAARRRRMTWIDAEVTELTALWSLSADADPVELVHADQHRILMTESGLEHLRIEDCIRFSRTVGYRQLLENVQVHGYRLMLDAGRALARSEIALDWYENVYRPTIDVIHEEGLNGVCFDATDPDRYLWVWERRRDYLVERPKEHLADSVRFASRDVARKRLGFKRRRRLDLSS
jgi:hypothetical protein